MRDRKAGTWASKIRTVLRIIAEPSSVVRRTDAAYRVDRDLSSSVRDNSLSAGAEFRCALGRVIVVGHDYLAVADQTLSRRSSAWLRLAIPC